MLLNPDFVFKNVLSITPDVLSHLKIDSLLLDLDNTLTTHNCPSPAPGVLKWLDEMHDAGVKMIIVSNNSFDRVKPFAKILGLSYVSMGMKPLPFGMKKAMRLAGMNPSNTAAVGDQIFTDIICANLLGIRSIYVYPILNEGTGFFKFKRFCEKPFLKNRKPWSEDSQ